jgi:hypothetical protein
LRWSSRKIWRKPPSIGSGETQEAQLFTLPSVVVSPSMVALDLRSPASCAEVFAEYLASEEPPGQMKPFWKASSAEVFPCDAGSNGHTSCAASQLSAGAYSFPYFLNKTNMGWWGSGGTSMHSSKWKLRVENGCVAVWCCSVGGLLVKVFLSSYVEPRRASSM